jgi:biopolymer transport protein ExbD
LISTRKTRRVPIEEPHVNLTPLIDVVFVLLIGFIVIAPLLQIDQVELAEASSSVSEHNRAAQTSSPIAIHVHQDNSIWWDKSAVTVAQLFQLLKEAKNQYPSAVPQLFHDKQGFFGTYQDVKNALEAAGFERVDVILQPG